MRDIEIELMTELIELLSQHDCFFDFAKSHIFEFRENWHHKIICDRLQKLNYQTNQRIMIFAPPRHTKSELMSRQFPAWYLGNNPNKEVICASYGDDLATEFNLAVQRIMETPEYKSVFPDVSIPKVGGEKLGGMNYRRNVDLFEILGKRGKYKTASVGGSLTGFGADLLLLDDPIKDWEDASSITKRDKLENWFKSTFMTRLQPGGNVVLTLTRWHEDDLAGRLLEKEKDKWEVIKFPGLYDDSEYTHPEDPREINEALWPSQKSADELVELRKSFGSILFSGLFQQTPKDEKGRTFKREWFRYYDVFDRKKGDLIFLSVDAAFEGEDNSDFCVLQTWAARGPERYLLNQVRKKLDFLDTLKEIESLMIADSRIRSILIEKKANGHGLLKILKRKFRGVVPSVPTKSKLMRAKETLPYWEAGNVFLPNPAGCPWMEQYEAELLQFPQAKHDDQVDATTQALNWHNADSLSKLRALASQ